MKRISKKGFSLIEVIATVVIMGILMSTVIVSVSKHLKKSHSNYCSQQVDMMIVAGRDYFNDKKTELPLEIGSEKCINLGYLQNNSYIEAIKDYSGGLCNTANSKVCAMKITGSNYYYTGYLDCGKCTSDNTKEENESVPTIEFYKNEGDVKDKDIIVEMKITDDVNEILSYSYTIYEKKDSGDVPIKHIDFREYKNKNPEIELNRKGTFYIEGYAYNSIGKRGYKKSGEYKLDYTLDCKKSVKINVKNKNDVLRQLYWVNGAIDINVDAFGAVSMYNLLVSKDGGSNWDIVLSRKFGENKYTYDDRQTGKYTIKIVAYDGFGNSCETEPETYYQDNVKPTCETKAFYDDNETKNYNGEWTNKKLYFKPRCTDNESGCNNNKNQGKVISIDYNGLASAGDVYDNAGNYSNCSGVVTKIDVTKPTCFVKLNGTKGENSYYISNVESSLEATDAGSGIVKYNFDTKSDTYFNEVSNLDKVNASAIYSTDTNENVRYYATVVDGAGNSSDCISDVFKIDKTSPECKFDISGDSTDFKKISAKPKVKLKCIDTGSGCKKADYGDLLKTGDLTGKTVKNKKITQVISDNAGNKTTCERNVNVYVDNQKPSCGTWTGNDAWTNSEVQVKVGCSDSGIGCRENTYIAKKYNQDNKEVKTVKNLEMNICDKLDNCRKCTSGTVNVYYDKKKPSCRISLNPDSPLSSGWYNRNVKGTLHKGGVSGNNQSPLGAYGMSASNTKVYNSTDSFNYNNDTAGAKFYGFIKDGAGNEAKCESSKFKIDTTPPVAKIENGDGPGIRNVEMKFFFSYNDPLPGSGMKCVGDTRCSSGNYFYTKVVSNGEEFDKYGKRAGETCYTNGWEPEDGRAPCADQGFFGKYWRAYYAEDNAGNKSNVICYYIEDNVPNSKINGVSSSDGKTCSVNGYTFTRP